MQPSLHTSTWLLARKLVRDYQFSVFHIETPEQSENGGQALKTAIHLILERRKRVLYMRLVPLDIYWAQVVERDVQESQRRLRQLTRRLGPQLDVINVYVLPESPSDDMVERAALASATPRHHGFSLHPLFLSVAQEAWYGWLDVLEKWDMTPSDLAQIAQESSDSLDAEEIRKDIQELERKREKEVLSVFRYGRPILTYAFLIVSTIVYGVVLMDGGVQNLDTLLRYGAKSNGLIIEGEWWRLITPIFLHLGSWHFLFNMIALYFLGTAVERIFGSKRFFLIFMLAGISGTVASFAFTDNLSAGASGAIFGCFGALLVFGQHYPKLFFRTMGRDILFFLGLNLTLGFVIPNIDNYGHIGGLVGGYFAAALVSLPLKRIQWVWRAAAGTVLAALLLFTASYGYAEGREGTDYLTWKGQQYIQEDNVTEALLIYEKLVKMEPENAFHHFYLGYVYSKTGRLKDAESSWKTALELEPNMPEAHYNLAVLYVGSGETERAKSHLLQARELDPDNEEVKALLEELQG